MVLGRLEEIHLRGWETRAVRMRIFNTRTGSFQTLPELKDGTVINRKLLGPQKLREYPVFWWEGFKYWFQTRRTHSHIGWVIHDFENNETLIRTFHPDRVKSYGKWLAMDFDHENAHIQQLHVRIRINCIMQ
jgi:hypothetical protein